MHWAHYECLDWQLVTLWYDLFRDDCFDEASGVPSIGVAPSSPTVVAARGYESMGESKTGQDSPSSPATIVPTSRARRSFAVG